MPIGLLCLALGFSVPGARAQAPSSDAESVASALLGDAKDLFQQGRFGDALPLLERAYALTGTPRYLFNLGVIHHKLSQCQPARNYFERYLLEDPAGSAQAEAKWALRELYLHCPESPGDESAAQARSPSPARRHPQPARGPTTAAPPRAGIAPSDERLALPSQRALILLGAGAAVGVAALVSVGLQNRAQNDIDALRARAAREGEVWDSYESQRTSLSGNAHLYRGMSIVLGIGSAVLAGSGATFWILDAPTPDTVNGYALTPGFSYSGRF
jgi:hypothetical protein